MRVRVRVLALLCAGLCAGCGEDDKPLPVIAQVPQFALTSHRGVELTLEKLHGQVWIANFMFTSCPDICPLLTKKMGDLRLGLTRKNASVQFVSFSVDPTTDTPDVLSAYAKERAAEYPDWHFLTGPNREIEQIVVGGFKQAVGPDPKREDNVLHGSHFVLVDQRGAIRGFYRSDADGLLELSRAAARLSAETAI